MEQGRVVIGEAGGTHVSWGWDVWSSLGLHSVFFFICSGTIRVVLFSSTPSEKELILWSIFHDIAYVHQGIQASYQPWLSGLLFLVLHLIIIKRESNRRLLGSFCYRNDNFGPRYC